MDPFCVLAAAFLRRFQETSAGFFRPIVVAVLPGRWLLKQIR